MELVSDSDNMVRIKAFEAAAKLIPQGILQESQISNEIVPMFLKFTTTVLEDEDGMQLSAFIFGRFIYSVYS